MALENLKIKLMKTAEKGTMDAPQFSITYKSDKNGRNGSHEILSMLKKENDLVIEVKSTLNFGSDAENEKLVNNYVDEIKKLNLVYNHRQMKAPAKATWFSFFSARNKTVEAHEIWAYIPDTLWSDESIQALIPAYAARYYITKKTDDPKELLNSIEQMPDSEKIDNFELIIFSVPEFSQMGITCNNISEADLREMLNLKASS